MECVIIETVISLPSTSSLPTTSPKRQEDCYQGTEESSTSNSREISHNNGHSYPGSDKSTDENSGHNQETHQDTNQRTVQQGTGGSKSCRKVNPPNPDAPHGPRQCHNIVPDDTPKTTQTTENTEQRIPSSTPQMSYNWELNPDPVETPNSVTSPGNITVISWNIRGFQLNRHLLLATIE